MKKTIITILIFLIFIAAGVLVFVYQPAEEKNNKEQINNTEEKIINYLEQNLLKANFGGKVFADYYEFGREDNRLFIWAYVAEYYIKNQSLRLGSAFSGPIIINFSENGKIKSHWQAKDGEAYAQSIKNKFPEKYHREVLAFNSEHKQVIRSLGDFVKEKARQKLFDRKADKTISVGETLSIRLEANQTTGYSWHYSIDNKDVIKVDSSEYKPDENEEGVLGKGGERIFKIKALKQGIAAIEFKYYRDWAPEQVEKTEKFRIKVKQQKQFDFKLPKGPDLKYVSIQSGKVEIFEQQADYPEGFDIEQGEIVCQKDFTEKTIKAKKCCFKKTSEGAAGTIYEDYNYITLSDSWPIEISFTLALDQCGNYPKPQRGECQKERENLDPKEIAVYNIENQ